MTSTKNQILDRLSKNLDKFSSVEQRAVNVEQRLAELPTGPKRELGNDAVERFKTKLEQVAASYSVVDNVDSIPREISTYLEKYQQPLSLVVADIEQLHINWPDYFKVHNGAADKNDKVAVSYAYAGIGETGSLVLRSSRQTPTTLNFLPDYYICVISQNDIVMTMEEVWSKHRNDFSSLPRALNVITGPSRTADVEQTIQLGAHGPRQLHVIIVKN